MEGIAFGLAIPVPGALVHPATVCVTVKVPAVPTVIDVVVSLVDQSKLVPAVVNTDEPQLFVTVTKGAAGAAGSVNATEGVFEAQPLLNEMV